MSEFSLEAHKWLFPCMRSENMANIAQNDA